jgi:hypothetical protein
MNKKRHVGKDLLMLNSGIPEFNVWVKRKEGKHWSDKSPNV